MALSRRALRLLAVFAVLAFGGLYLARHGEDLRLLRSASLPLVALLIALSGLAPVMNGAVLALLARKLGVRLRCREWYGLTVLHAFGNYLPLPQAGSAVRGLYLKRIHGLPYRRFAALVLVSYVQFLATVGVLGVATLGGSVVFGGRTAPLPLWLLFAGFAATELFHTRWWAAWPRMRFLRDGAGGLRELQQPGVLARVSLAQSLLIGIHALALWVAFQALGRPVPAAHALLLALVAMASGVANVTPGNLGIAEAAAWTTARLTGGSDPAQTVVAYLLVRMTALVPVTLLAPWFTARLTRPGTPVREGEASRRAAAPPDSRP